MISNFHRIKILHTSNKWNVFLQEHFRKVCSSFLWFTSAESGASTHSSFKKFSVIPEKTFEIEIKILTYKLRGLFQLNDLGCALPNSVERIPQISSHSLPEANDFSLCSFTEKQLKIFGFSPRKIKRTSFICCTMTEHWTSLGKQLTRKLNDLSDERRQIARHKWQSISLRRETQMKKTRRFSPSSAAAAARRWVNRNKHSWMSFTLDSKRFFGSCLLFSRWLRRWWLRLLARWHVMGKSWVGFFLRKFGKFMLPIFFI